MLATRWAIIPLLTLINAVQRPLPKKVKKNDRRWNKGSLGYIVEYILHAAPPGSYGNTNLVQDWINQGVAFEQHQKQRVVDILSTP